MAGIGKVKALQIWCKNRLIGYRDVEITNMTTSWRSGMAFCALIHKFRPDLIDYDSLSKENVFENNELAFSVAETLNVPALLDAEDMVRLEVPDKLSIITYVAQLHNCFKDEVPAGGPDIKTASKRHSTPVRRSVTMRSPESKRRPMATSKKAETASTPDICIICDGKVYLIEKHIVDGKLYHRSCFRTNNRKSDTSALTGSPKLSQKSTPSRPSVLSNNGLKKAPSSLPSTPSTPPDNRPDWQKKLQERSLAKKAAASAAIPRTNSQTLLETLPEDRAVYESKPKPDNEIDKVKLRSKTPASASKRPPAPRAVSVGVDLDERIVKLRQLRESAKAASSNGSGNSAVKARLERLQKIASKESTSESKAAPLKSASVADTKPEVASQEVQVKSHVETNVKPSTKVDTVEQSDHVLMETDSQSSNQSSPIHSSQDLSVPEPSKPTESKNMLDAKSSSDNKLEAKLEELKTESSNPFEMEEEESSAPAPTPSTADKTTGAGPKEQPVVVEKLVVKADGTKSQENDIELTSSNTTSKSAVTISTGSSPSAPTRPKRTHHVKSRPTTTSNSVETGAEEPSTATSDVKSASYARLPISSLNITVTSSSTPSADSADEIASSASASSSHQYTVSASTNDESFTKIVAVNSTAESGVDVTDTVSADAVPPAKEVVEVGEDNRMECKTESCSSLDASAAESEGQNVALLSDITELPVQTTTNAVAEDIKLAEASNVEHNSDVSSTESFVEVVNVIDEPTVGVKQSNDDSQMADKLNPVPADTKVINHVEKALNPSDPLSQGAVKVPNLVAEDSVGNVEKQSDVKDMNGSTTEGGSNSDEESKPKPVRPPRSPAVSKKRTEKSDGHSQVTAKSADTTQHVKSSENDTHGISQQVKTGTKPTSRDGYAHPHEHETKKTIDKKLAVESSTSPVVMRKDGAKEVPPRPKTVAAGSASKSQFFLDKEHTAVVEPPPKPVRQPALAAVKDHWEDSLASWSGKRKDKNRSTWYTAESYPTECNPFGDDEEEVPPTADQQNQTIPPAAPPADSDYDSSLNPFADDDNEPTIEAVNTEAVEQPSSHVKVKIMPSNPFEVSDDEEPEENFVSKKKIVPDVGLDVEKPKRAHLNKSYGIILPDTTGKKITPKKKLAPPPPQTPPSALPVTQPQALLSDNKENTVQKLPEPQTSNETTPKDKYTERDNSRLTDIAEDDSASIEAQKRRHRPAPPRPMPPKRRPHSDYGVEPDDIAKELAAIESKQRQLEDKGRQLEQAIRTADEAMGTQPGGADEDELLSSWLDTINEKNHLVRRESELVFIAKHQELETQQADVEWELRQIMHQAENLKTDDDKLREEDLLQKLVTVVTERSKLVDKMDDERLRQQDEDRKIDMVLGSKSGHAADKSPNPSSKAGKKAKKKDKKSK